MHRHLLVHWIPESDSKLCRVVGEENREQQWVRGATRHNSSGGIAAEIMWRQLRQAEFRSVVLHNMPDHSVSHEIAPDLPSPTNTPKQFPTANAGRGDPLTNRPCDPIRNRHRPNVAAFSCQVNYGPVILTALNIVQLQCRHLATAQSTSQKKRQDH